MSNYLRLDDRFPRSRCFRCKNWIRQGAVRIRAEAFQHVYRNFHLWCYRPVVASPISFERNVDNCLRDDKKVERAKKWVDGWNQQFEVSEDLLPAKYSQKAVKTRCPAARRTLLHAFQYLKFTEIEQVAALACKAWFHVSRDEELWAALYTAGFRLPDTKSRSSYRKQYIVMHLRSCWLCHEVPTVEEISIICPFRKRPLCNDCSQTNQGRIVSVKGFCKELYIDKSIVKPPDFKVFYSNRVESGYLQDLSGGMAVYAEKRRKVLLEYLETVPKVLSPKAISKIRKFDLTAFYSNVGHLLWFNRGSKTRSEEALLSFFGTNEDREDWNTSVKELIEEIKEEERK